jgi:PhnB protein
MQVPPQYNRLMPYLILPRAAEFIEFMKKVFGASVQMIVPRSESVIMHAELRIGDSVVMLADQTPEFSARPAGMFIYVDNVDQTYELALKENAQSMMKPGPQPYGYTCGFKDPFGNDWWPTQTSIAKSE